MITVRENLRRLNPKAILIEAASPLFVDDPAAIRGKRVLVIEDGPTLTHGEMAYGAGWVAARRFGAAEIVDPRPYAVGSIAATLREVSHDRPGPARHGLGDAQIRDLEQTINNAPMRPGDHRHAHRPDPGDQDQQAHPARALRAAGDRPAHSRGDPDREVRTQGRGNEDHQGIDTLGIVSWRDAEQWFGATRMGWQTCPRAAGRPPRANRGSASGSG